MAAPDRVDVSGRYEAFDQGRHRLVGADGPTPWLCMLALGDGTWLRLGARPDHERARLLGRTVTAHGRLHLPPPAPPHVAQLEPALTLIDVVIDDPGELPVDDTVPATLTGPRRVADVVTTHLEMDHDRAPQVDAPAGATLIAALPPSVAFYRWLYDAVGAPWHWYDRKRLDDAALAAIISHPRVHCHVAYLHGSPVGFAELDRRPGDTCDLAYFGLVPEAIGRGLGRWLLAETVHLAWRDPALRRLAVHTCNLDGAAALPNYQRCGFAPYQHSRHRQWIVDPQVAG